MAPKSESRPPVTHTAYTMRALPTAAIISRGTRKIPDPIMMPTTIASAFVAVNTRGSSSCDRPCATPEAIAGRLSEPHCFRRRRLEVKPLISPIKVRRRLSRAQEIDVLMLKRHCIRFVHSTHDLDRLILLRNFLRSILDHRNHDIRITPMCAPKPVIILSTQSRRQIQTLALPQKINRPGLTIVVCEDAYMLLLLRRQRAIRPGHDVNLLLPSKAVSIKLWQRPRRESLHLVAMQMQR